MYLVLCTNTRFVSPCELVCACLRALRACSPAIDALLRQPRLRFRSRLSSIDGTSILYGLCARVCSFDSLTLRRTNIRTCCRPSRSDPALCQGRFERRTLRRFVHGCPEIGFRDSVNLGIFSAVWIGLSFELRRVRIHCDLVGAFRILLPGQT